jgi:hypothetical protein
MYLDIPECCVTRFLRFLAFSFGSLQHFAMTTSMRTFLMRTIVHPIRAILRKFKEWVEIAFDKVPARRELQNPKAKEECMGMKVNNWNRAKSRR